MVTCFDVQKRMFSKRIKIPLQGYEKKGGIVIFPIQDYFTDQSVSKTTLKIAVMMEVNLFFLQGQIQKINGFYLF